MDRHLIKIVWGAVLFALVFRFGLFLASAPPLNARFFLVALLFVIGCGALTYLTVRAMLFRRNLHHFLRRLLSGNYDTGIRTYPHLNDEIAQLERLLNNLGDRLRTYDRLRAQHVAANRRALDMLFCLTPQPALLLKVDSGTLQINPAAQAFLDTDQQTMNLDTLDNYPTNGAFVSLVRSTIDHTKVPSSDGLSLTWPGKKTERGLFVAVLPVEDASERVWMAVILLQESHQKGGIRDAATLNACLLPQRIAIGDASASPEGPKKDQPLG